MNYWEYRLDCPEYTVHVSHGILDLRCELVFEVKPNIFGVSQVRPN